MSSTRNELLLRVVFQPNSHLFRRVSSQVEVYLSCGTVLRKKSAINKPPKPTVESEGIQCETTELLSSLLESVRKKAAGFGFMIPQDANQLRHEYYFIKCLSVGLPIQLLDLNDDKTAPTCLTFKHEEYLLLTKRQTTVRVNMLPGVSAYEGTFDMSAGSSSVTEQLLLENFTDNFNGQNYALCLVSENTNRFEPTTVTDLEPSQTSQLFVAKNACLNWAGMGVQMPTTVAAFGSVVQKNVASSSRQSKANSQPTNSLQVWSQEIEGKTGNICWCWMDELYDSLYQIDVSAWQCVWLRKRYFSILNELYVNWKSVGSDKSIAGSSNRENSTKYRLLSNARQRFETFDVYQDAIESRQTLLKMVRYFGIDEKSWENTVRKLSENIASETNRLSVCDWRCSVNEKGSCINADKHTIHLPASTLDKQLKVNTLLDTLSNHVDSVRIVVHRGVYHVNVSRHFKIFVKNLFAVRASRYRLFNIVRIGYENFLPILLCTNNFIFVRVEARKPNKPNSNRTIMYQLKTTFERSRIMPHDSSKTFAKSSENPYAVRSPVPSRKPLSTMKKHPDEESTKKIVSVLHPTTQSIFLKNFVCWRNDSAVSGYADNRSNIFKRRLTPGLMRSRNRNNVFRYFCWSAENIESWVPRKSSKIHAAITTISLHDLSNSVLLINGIGVRGIIVAATILSSLPERRRVMEQKNVREVNYKKCIEEYKEKTNIDKSSTVTTLEMGEEIHRQINEIFESENLTAELREKIIQEMFAGKANADWREKTLEGKYEGKATTADWREKATVNWRENTNSNQHLPSCAKTTVNEQTCDLKGVVEDVHKTYNNLKYVNMLLRQHLSEELPMFETLRSEYEKFNDRLFATEDLTPEQYENLAKNILTIMETIYRNLPFMLNQLLLMQKFEMYNTIVKLL